MIPVQCIAEWREKVWWKGYQLLQPDSNNLSRQNRVGSVSPQFIVVSQRKRSIYWKRDWVILKRSYESGSMSVHTPWKWIGILIAQCHTVTDYWTASAEFGTSYQINTWKCSSIQWFQQDVVDNCNSQFINISKGKTYKFQKVRKSVARQVVRERKWQPVSTAMKKLHRLMDNIPRNWWIYSSTRCIEQDCWVLYR